MLSDRLKFLIHVKIVRKCLIVLISFKTPSPNSIFFFKRQYILSFPKYISLREKKMIHWFSIKIDSNIDQIFPQFSISTVKWYYLKSSFFYWSFVGLK